MANVTLQNLRDWARARADMEGDDATDGFSRDTVIDPMINAAMFELDEILIETYEHYRTEKVNLSLVSGTSEYALPDNFFKARGVDLKLSSAADDFVKLKSFMWSERERYARASTAWAGTLNGAYPRYSIQGTKIFFYPTPDSAQTVVLHYVPTLDRLSDPAATYNSIHGFEEYIVVDVAMKLLDREESDSKHLADQKERLIRRIRGAAVNRDAEEPMRMLVTRGDPFDGGGDFDPPWRRGW